MGPKRSYEKFCHWVRITSVLRFIKHIFITNLQSIPPLLKMVKEIRHNFNQSLAESKWRRTSCSIIWDTEEKPVLGKEVIRLPKCRTRGQAPLPVSIRHIVELIRPLIEQSPFRSSHQCRLTSKNFQKYHFSFSFQLYLFLYC